jgi:hypothetical protein
MMDMKILIERFIEDQDKYKEKDTLRQDRFRDSVEAKLERISGQLTKVESDARTYDLRIAQNTKDINELDRRFNRHASQKKHWSDAENVPLPDEEIN